MALEIFQNALTLPGSGVKRYRSVLIYKNIVKIFGDDVFNSWAYVNLREV